MNIKISFKLISVLLLLTLLIACKSNTPSVGMEYKVSIIDEYSYEGVLNAELNIPRGLAIVKDQLFVVDSGNHRIAVIDISDSEETSVTYIGQIGSAPGDLLNPQAILSDGGELLYIADSGNSRIQVINTKGEYVIEYDVNLSSNPNTTLQDLTFWDDSHLILSVNSLDSKAAHLYMLDLETGEIDNINGKLTGFLTNSNHGDIYALSNLELYSTKDVNGGRSGRHSLYSVKENKISEVALLPNHYMPNDAFISGGYLYTTSRSFISVDKFALDGTHLGTIYRPHDVDAISKEPPYEFTYLAMNGQHLYVTDSKNNSIIVLKKKEL